MRLFLVFALLLFQNQPQTPHHHKEAVTPKNVESQPVQVSPISKPVGIGNEKTPASQAENGNAYDPRTDCLYRWYLRFTIIGVVGGFIGIGVLIWQAILTRESIVAANKSANALMNAEQAVLKIISIEIVSFQDNWFTYRLANIGKTAATLYATHGSFQVGDSKLNPPDPSIYTAKVGLRPEFIIESDFSDNAGYTFTEKHEKLAPEQVADVQSGKQFLWACGFFSYRDNFGRPFTQRYCYLWGKDYRLKPAGPWEYRRLI